MLIAVPAGQPLMTTSNFAVVAVNVTVAFPVQLASASAIGGFSFAAFSSALNVLATVGTGVGVGLAVGGAADLDNARIGDDFIEDVTKVLLPNTVAVVAEIEEDWTTPVDTRMEAIGGSIFRRALSDVRDTVDREEVSAMKADLAQMKGEYAQARADRQGKLREKINRLDSKIQARLQKAKDKRQAVEQQAQAKAQILKSKAQAARARLT